MYLARAAEAHVKGVDIRLVGDGVRESGQLFVKAGSAILDVIHLKKDEQKEVYGSFKALEKILEMWLLHIGAAHDVDVIFRLANKNLDNWKSRTNVANYIESGALRRTSTSGFVVARRTGNRIVEGDDEFNEVFIYSPLGDIIEKTNDKDHRNDLNAILDEYMKKKFGIKEVI